MTWMATGSPIPRRTPAVHQLKIARTENVSVYGTAPATGKCSSNRGVPYSPFVEHLLTFQALAKNGTPPAVFACNCLLLWFWSVSGCRRLWQRPREGFDGPLAGLHGTLTGAEGIE